MAREFARKFYHSQAWKDARAAYFRYRHGLCEACLRKGIYKAGEIVHHKNHLTPDNINDASVTLGFGNLELLCRDCHAEQHPEIYTSKAQQVKQRVAFDEFGNTVRLESDAKI